MRSTRKNEEKVKAKKITRDDLTNSVEKDERLKRNAYTVSTPRNFLQKSSTADIYAKKLPTKKINTPRNNESPMKDFLSPSTSQKSKSSHNKMAVKTQSQKNTPKRLVLTNVTVSSPVVKRRLNLDGKESPRGNTGERKQSATSKSLPKDQIPGRQRTKTRTLEDDEVKILTPEVLDNNAAMQDLSRQLAAKPKAFFVDLDERPKETKVNVKEKDKSSEDEVSYEDDFESYESDFESYHSEAHSDASATHSGETSGEDEHNDKRDEEVTSKDIKDEEKMLDSGNFELGETQRSARKPVMDFILEGSEATETTEDKKASLTDEGFQEMSSSSTGSSMRIVHTEVLDRPLFIDFTKSKENKRKRKILEKFKQRAKDILSMVTLHEISYTLFEMKPIPYDLYMASFGRKNYTQSAVQTFEDGITEEIQTDVIFNDNKWTQFPVEFSKNIIFYSENVAKSYRDDDFEGKFKFLINADIDDRTVENEEYKTNPLKLFLEQKDGVGNDSLPEEKYKRKLENKEFNINKLRKFLKKSESIISSILSLNDGSGETLNLVKTSKLSFSKGFINISPKNIKEEKLEYLKYTKTTGVTISDTKENLIMTYHNKPSSSDTTQCVICLWDTSVARCEPLKVLKAAANVVIGRYRGNTNGIFAAGLQDGTLHLWDLSEEPSWCNDVASCISENTTKLVEIETSRMSQIEIDREWNLKNSHVTCEEKPQCTMQVSSYTSSAVNMYSKDSVDNIVGLEFVGDAREMSQESGRKVVGQICTLQKLGLLVIWSINQEKSTTTHDIGKAFWSNIRLEKKQSLYLSEHVDKPINKLDNSFNLNAAKRRLSNRKQERVERRKEITRPKSAILKSLDRPSSVASPRKNLPISRNMNEWDSALICNHLKVLRLNKIDNYLVAMSNGEVLCCKHSLRDFKLDRLFVASDKSPITRLEVTHNNLPYFLTATDSGTVNIYSVLEARVLLTLDCRNGPPLTTDRCQADHKGRFVASVPSQSTTEFNASKFHSKFSIKSLTWSATNPFCVLALLSTGTLVTWELTHSDINAKSVVNNAAVECTSSRSNSVAFLTMEGEVHIHRLSGEQDRSSVELFKKYVALL